MTDKQVVHFPVHIGTYADFLTGILALAESSRSSYVCVANVHMFVEAYQNKAFLETIRSADYVTPDGLPLAWALRLLYNIKQERVAGMDLLPDLLAKAAEKKLPVFFYGGTQQMLDSTKNYIENRYKDVQIAGMYSPPFRALDSAEEEAIARQINDSGCRMVFVVLGCPKQEKWMAGMKGKVNAVMIGIGGALPVLIGTQKRAPKWMQKAGLEWFFRLCQEPGRLFKRYAITNSVFLYLIAKEFIKRRILRIR